MGTRKHLASILVIVLASIAGDATAQTNRVVREALKRCLEVQKSVELAPPEGPKSLPFAAFVQEGDRLAYLRDGPDEASAILPIRILPNESVVVCPVRAAGRADWRYVLYAGYGGWVRSIHLSQEEPIDTNPPTGTPPSSPLPIVRQCSANQARMGIAVRDSTGAIVGAVAQGACGLVCDPAGPDGQVSMILGARKIRLPQSWLRMTKERGPVKAFGYQEAVWSAMVLQLVVGGVPLEKTPWPLDIDYTQPELTVTYPEGSADKDRGPPNPELEKARQTGIRVLRVLVPGDRVSVLRVDHGWYLVQKDLDPFWVDGRALTFVSSGDPDMRFPYLEPLQPEPFEPLQRIGVGDPGADATGIVVRPGWAAQPIRTGSLLTSTEDATEQLKVGPGMKVFAPCTPIAETEALISVPYYQVPEKWKADRLRAEQARLDGLVKQHGGKGVEPYTLMAILRHRRTNDPERFSEDDAKRLAVLEELYPPNRPIVLEPNRTYRAGWCPECEIPIQPVEGKSEVQAIVELDRDNGYYRIRVVGEAMVSTSGGKVVKGQPAVHLTSSTPVQFSYDQGETWDGVFQVSLARDPGWKVDVAGVEKQGRPDKMPEIRESCLLPALADPKRTEVVFMGRRWWASPADLDLTWFSLTPTLLDQTTLVQCPADGPDFQAKAPESAPQPKPRVTGSVIGSGGGRFAGDAAPSGMFVAGVGARFRMKGLFHLGADIEAGMSRNAPLVGASITPAAEWSFGSFGVAVGAGPTFLVVNEPRSWMLGGAATVEAWHAVGDDFSIGIRGLLGGHGDLAGRTPSGVNVGLSMVIRADFGREDRKAKRLGEPPTALLEEEPTETGK